MIDTSSSPLGTILLIKVVKDQIPMLSDYANFNYLTTFDEIAL